METLKNIIRGIFLSMQFFTSIPIRRNIEVNEKSITTMYIFLPVISFLMGITSAFIVYINHHYLSFTPLFLSIILVVLNMAMTGGLHLDGLIDVGDAYFSYRDKERRLEILSDSRVGAFGVLTVTVFLLLKIGIFYELFVKSVQELMLYFIFIPVISRIAMLLYFSISKTAKEEGLAAYFKKQINGKILFVFIIMYIILIGIRCLFLKKYILIFLVLFSLSMAIIFRKWTSHHFGGMTGDLLGAFYEGIELLLWMIVLLSAL